MMFASVGVEAGQEEQAEQRAAERDLVDECGHGRVEQRAGVGAHLGEADPVVAQERVDHGLRGADQAVREAPCHRLRAIPGPEEEVDLR